MRGGFVACLGTQPPEASRVEAAAAALRWHRGEAAAFRHGRLVVAALVDREHGPFVAIDGDRLLLAHGAPPEPLDELTRHDRYAGLESDGRGFRAIRDPMGEVPLFRRVVGEELWLATEVQALVAVAPVEPDLEWLAAFAAMVELPRRTCWVGIERVLPGERLAVDDRLGIEVDRHFRPDSIATRGGISEAEAASELRTLFESAVDRRADEGCGILLSGGLDSSAVAVVAARKARPILLTLAHPSLPGVDETQYARAVADSVGIPLTTVEVEPDPWIPAADIAALGMPPLAAPTAMHQQAFRAFAELGCTTVLDGHDGDGTLGSLYAWSGNTLLDMRLDRLVRAAREFGPRTIARDTIADLVPPRWLSTLRRADGAGGGRQSFAPYFRGATAERLARDLAWRPPKQGWRRSQLRALLPPTTQHFEEVELVAAQFGVDIRHPFADRRLIEFLVALPHSVKVSTTRLKPLLRRALGDLLPPIVANRDDKTGFVPVIDARVDFESCYLTIRDSPVRLPDVDYGRLFRDAVRPVADRMLWMRLASAHAFLTEAAS